MNTPNVLVVDDEKPLRDFVRRNLEVREFSVLTAANGLEALAFFDTDAIDLVILDIMMPRMDGLETIERIRKRSMVPIIVLSAMGEENDIIRAFDMGVDDYLTKPFGVGELLARVRAVMRRSVGDASPAATGTVVHGGITVDLDRRAILVNGKALELTPTEYNLVLYFAQNAGKVLSHRAILQNVWGPEYGQESEYLRVYIGRLRQKFEVDPSKPSYFVTVHGVGYIFEGG